MIQKKSAGAARLTNNPRDLFIAERCAEVIASSRRFKEGYSFQTGAGAISIAVTKYLHQKTQERNIHASFALGGITGTIIDMYDAGLLKAVECSQSFDSIAAKAIMERPGVLEIDNSNYSNPYTKGGFLNREDFGVLGALEVDTDFNVNVLTGSTGHMMGGLGGGPDVAAGAQLSIVTIPIIRGRMPSIVKKVRTVCEPGETIAAVVTEAGIALNPRHRNYAEISEDAERAGLNLVSIEHLQKIAERLTGIPKHIPTAERIACIVEYRDGSVLDLIYCLKP